MTLSSYSFLQVGEASFRQGEFIRTFFEPKTTCDNFLICERLNNGEVELFINKSSKSIVTQLQTDNQEFWSLPKSNESPQTFPKFPTAGTALYTHAYSFQDTLPLSQGTWVKVDEIFQRFFEDKPIGIELVHAALKILNKHEKRLEINVSNLPEASLGQRYEEVENKRIKKEDLKKWEQDTLDVFPINCTEIENPDRPFISVGRYQDEDGVENEYAIRKGLDSQDSVCFCWHGGNIYMAIRLGVRTALSHWEQGRSLISIEGVAGSLEENDLTTEDIINRAMEETKEELGLEPASPGIKLGSFFTASEVTAEKSTSVLVEVNPNKKCTAHHAADEIQDTRFIELDELIAACDEGLIIDERLEVSARLLKAMYRYHNPLHIPQSAEKIVFLGGTFDPFHSGHLALANACLNESTTDAVIVVPAKQNPYKGNPYMQTSERRDSIVATLSEYPGLYLSEHELNQRDSSVYTADSLKLFKEQFPQCKSIFLAVGSDLLGSMHAWTKRDELFKRLDGLFIAARDDFSVFDLKNYKAMYPKEAWSLIQKAKFLTFQQNISSSLIKKLLFSSEDVPTDGLLPRRVRKFI
jgi:nicotinate-nucleotide adenylyltransferase